MVGAPGDDKPLLETRSFGFNEHEIIDTPLSTSVHLTTAKGEVNKVGCCSKQHSILAEALISS